MKRFMEGHVCRLHVLSTLSTNPHYVQCSMLHSGETVSINVWVYEKLKDKKWFWAQFDGDIVSSSFCVRDVSHT